MSGIDPTLLDYAFGSDSIGTTAEERARTSKRSFVRSVDQIAEATSTAKGRRLTAFEAYEAYGLDVLLGVAAEGAVLASADPRAVGNVLRDRRETLGLEIAFVARRAKLDPRVVSAAEASKRLPVREYERIARTLALDERMLSFSTEPHGGRDVAVRLRTLGIDVARVTPAVVSAIAEAAWVAATQQRLESWLALPEPSVHFTPSPDYGGPGRPAYVAGYALALDCRLKLGVSDAIPSLRDLAERILRVPVIQTHLGESVAGVTVETEQNRRAIVVNIDKANANPLIRRSTIAHELGHLLFDSSSRLNTLRVDDYDDLKRSPEQRIDPVEQRANAFSVELIAPQRLAIETYREANSDLGAVMSRFGVSHTAAMYQIWNGLERSVSLDQIHATTRPGPEWDGRETYTLDWHPLGDLRVSRAGRFSAVVVRAASMGFVSWDTANEYLELDVTEDVFLLALPALAELFPDVFRGPG